MGINTDVSKVMQGNSRIPVIGNFELTRRCPLNCVICYNERKQKRELTTDEVKKVLRLRQFQRFQRTLFQSLSVSFPYPLGHRSKSSQDLRSSAIGRPVPDPFHAGTGTLPGCGENGVEVNWPA